MKEKNTNTIETERLILRKLEADDYTNVFKNWTSDFEVSKYVTWQAHENAEQTKKLVEYWVNEYDKEYTYRWGIVLKETNEIIGVIDVIKKNIQYQTCELGYCYGSAWWGKGYATETLKAVIDYLHNCGFVVVTAEHFKSNIASGKVMEKAGMKYEATLKLRVVNKNGDREDVLVFSSITD